MNKISDAAGAIKVQADLILAEAQTISAAAVLTPAQKALQDAAIAYAVSVGYAKPGAAPTPVPVPTPTPTPKGFRLLDATNYIGKPGQTVLPNGELESGIIPGFEGAIYLHEPLFYPAGQDRAARMGVAPTDDGIAAAYAHKVKGNAKRIVVINLENLPWAFVVDDATFLRSVQQIADVCRKVRALATADGRTIELAFYGFVPWGVGYQYIKAGDSDALAAQAKRLPAINAAMKPIVDQVDFLTPCLYPDPGLNAADHGLWAKAVIAAGKAMGKPVIPHWDWRYQVNPTPNVPNSNPNPVAPEPIWRALLQGIKSDADGVAFWGGNDLSSTTGAPLPWSEQDGAYVALMSEVS